MKLLILILSLTLSIQTFSSNETPIGTNKKIVVKDPFYYDKYINSIFNDTLYIESSLSIFDIDSTSKTYNQLISIEITLKEDCNNVYQLLLNKYGGDCKQIGNNIIWCVDNVEIILKKQNGLTILKYKKTSD